MFENIAKKKEKTSFLYPALKSDDEKKAEIPDGTYAKCQICGVITHRDDLHKNQKVCPACGYHFRLNHSERTEFMFDFFEPLEDRMQTADPLSFPGYKDKLRKLKKETGLYDSIVYGDGVVGGHKVVGVIMDPFFFMGSMGSVTGEKVTHAFERAMRYKKPLVLFSASGGARMQEGLISLMQMAKTSGAAGKFSSYGGLFINVLTDPTTGGVTASFAMLGDITLAEPGALVGFAGPRVIEQTVRQKLAPDFQRAEFLQEKGFVDKVVHRHELKRTLSSLLRMHEVSS